MKSELFIGCDVLQLRTFPFRMNGSQSRNIRFSVTNKKKIEQNIARNLNIQNC